MPVDQDSLARALEARGRMDRAHREALLARGEFNAAVAALHQAGATLREIAEALDISHQRVHQIVGQEPTFWDRLTRRPPRRRPVAICSFCGRRQHEVARLVAGPGVYICDRCIGLATEVAATGAAQESAAGPIVPIAVEIALRCSFCGKQRRDVTAMVARDDVRICGSCLQLCREVLATDVRRSP